jgi:hypothetical protein
MTIQSINGLPPQRCPKENPAELLSTYVTTYNPILYGLLWTLNGPATLIVAVNGPATP